ncbi:MAG: acylphosphatase [Planctomycetota bacterium]|jgi:acylphosphatase
MEQTAKNVIFSGRVQGVGFRFTALYIANRYKLTGFVRNAPDGTVELVLQGNTNDVNGCIQDIQESFAEYIRDVKIEEITFEAQYEDFKITF